MKRSLLAVASWLALVVGGASAQTLTIHHLDVGQGDATLIVSPTGQSLLIDAGYNGMGNSRIRPYLQSLGITQLDYIVATHYDADHIGGIDEIIQAGFGPTQFVYDRGSFGGTPGTQSYFDYQSAVGSKRRTILPGNVINLGGGVTLICKVVNGNIHTFGSIDISGSSQFENSASVGLLLTYNDFDYWVAGDLTGGGNGTTDVESILGPRVGNVDVYQVHHHSSRTSTNAFWVSQTQPDVSIVSLGDSNPYGYPKQEVIDRLNSRSVASFVYQTAAGNPAFGAIDASNNGTVLGHVILETDGERTYTIQGSAIRPVTFLFDEITTELAELGQITTTEFHADPGSVIDGYGEYFEIRSVSYREHGLAGYTFEDFISDRFTLRSNVLLSPGERLLIGRNGFPGLNGGYLPDLAWPTGSFDLSNGSDAIRILNTQLQTVESFAYNTSHPIQSGAAAEKIDVNDSTAASNWAPATTSYGLGDQGTPDQANSVGTGVFPPQLSLEGTPSASNPVHYELDGLAGYNAGDLLQVLISVTGDGTQSGGIPLPDGSGRVVPLDFDAATTLALNLPVAFTATVTTPTTSTFAVPFPSAPVGVTVYASALTIDLAQSEFRWIIPTITFVTQ